MRSEVPTPQRSRWLLGFVVSFQVLAVGFQIALVVSLWPRTEYPAGYSEQAFQRLKVGAEAGEVTAALGAPLEVWQERRGGESFQWLSYSRPAPGCENYRIRAVRVDGSGRVVELRAETNLD